MRTLIPSIDQYMTACPHSIGVDQTLAVAHRLMRTYKIRHLPVLTGGRLVGVVTDRDLKLMETLRDVDPEEVPVEDAMSAEPYAVEPGTPLDAVAAEMAERKYGCAIIMQSDKVVGIFTAIDACATLAELLRSGLPK